MLASGVKERGFYCENVNEKFLQTICSQKRCAKGRLSVFNMGRKVERWGGHLRVPDSLSFRFVRV